jgi:hypothetical protein
MMLPLLLPALLLVAAPAKPSWIANLPEQPKMVFGLGVAPASNTRALALRQASDSARSEVLSRLRANIKSDTQIGTDFTETKSAAGKKTAASASRTTNAKTDVRVHAEATDLPGLSVQATFLDEDGPSPTLYALAVLDVDVADQEVRARYDTIAASLAMPRGDLQGREIFHRIQLVKKAVDGLAKLDDLSGLLRAGGGDPSLRESILKSQMDAERERTALRSMVTFGFAPSSDLDLSKDVEGAVRTVILKEGLGWNDQEPMYAIAMRVQTGRNGVLTSRKAWWEHKPQADFILAQGTISLTLVDKTGQAFESTLVVAKGVGITEFQADTLLLQDYKRKLTTAVSQWLADLGN